MFELLLVFGLIVLWIQVLQQRQRLAQLERSIEVLEKLHRAQSVWIETLDTRFDLAPPPGRPLPEAPARAAPSAAAADRQLASAPSALPPPPPPPPRTTPSSPPPPKAPTEPQSPLALSGATAAPSKPPPPAPARPAPAPPASPPLWTRLERLFSEHWSGILGVLVLVAGVTFLAINVALRLGPLQRFLVVAAVSLALGLPSALVGRRPPWRDLAAWMRSGGGALFLFACTAAGAFPQLGLRWIDDPLVALALVALGVALNLILAGIARTQAIASLHVVVNLVPLLILPPTLLTLVMASGVALVGDQLPIGRPWNRHRLIVTWAYGLYHALWFQQSAPLLAADPWVRLPAALAAVVVFGGSALRQQRSRHVPDRLQGLPLALQLSDWGALALALLVYPQQASVRASALALAALTLLGLWRRARQRGWRWLALSNVLLGQSFVLAALFSLHPLIANGPLLLFAMQIECALFLVLGQREGDGTILRVGWGLTALAGLLLALAGLGQGLSRLGVLVGGGAPSLAVTPQTLSVLIGGTVLTTGVQVWLQRREATLPEPLLLGWLGGAQAFVAAAVAPAQTVRPLVALALMGPLVLLARRLRPPGLLAGTTAAILLLHLTDWSWLLLRHPLAPQPVLLHLLCLAALAVALIRGAPASPLRLLGFDLLGLTIGLGAFLLLDPIAPQLPGVAWLMLSPLALEIANRLGRPWALHSLLLGLGALVAFGGSYLLVINQSPALFSLGLFSVRGRLLIELFAIAVALYWALFPSGPGLAPLRLWQAIQPCFVEVALLGVSLMVLTEISVLWRPLVWSLLALALLAPPLRRLFPIRLQLYSVLVYWVAVATLVALLGSLASPSLQWWAQPHQIGLLTIALQTAYVVATHRWLDLEGLRHPGGLAPLAWLGHRLANGRNAWLSYPMFAAVALYLGVRYDRSLLTLLWSAQALGIYGLGAVLRERPFRHLALLGLGACLVRLLAIDMAQADLGLRGLVFVGVGVLMLALNAIANRFRSRFE